MMKRGLEALDESKFFVDDATAHAAGLPKDTMLYFGEVTEGLEFIAADELKSRLRRDWTTMGGDSEIQAQADLPADGSQGWIDRLVRYQEGSGLIFFHLPTSDAISAIRARSAFLGGLLTVETVFVFLDRIVGLPQDESGLDVIERYVQYELDAAKLDRALHVWALHFRELEAAAKPASDAASPEASGEVTLAVGSEPLHALTSAPSFAPVFRCSCRRRGDQTWQSQAVAGYAQAGQA
jgi:hypothetical protein